MGLSGGLSLSLSLSLSLFLSLYFFALMIEEAGKSMTLKSHRAKFKNWILERSQMTKQFGHQPETALSVSLYLSRDNSIFKNWKKTICAIFYVHF